MASTATRETRFPTTPYSYADIDPNRDYSLAALACATGHAVSEATLRRRVTEGKIPQVPRLHRWIRVRGSDFLNWIYGTIAQTSKT